MKANSIVEKIVTVVEPVLADQGFELVDVEYQTESGEWVLRLLVDCEGGITLDQCAEVSREVGLLIDVDELITHAYRFEVSSPGIERPLKKLGDFERFAGKLAKIKTLESIDPDGRGQNRKTFRGILKGVREGRIVLEQNDKKGGDALFDLAQIEQANLEFEW